MTIKSKLNLNLVLVLLALAIVALTSIVGMTGIKKKITFLTQKTTPYQLKALNQEQLLQEHLSNLLIISNASSIAEYEPIVPVVKTSFGKVKEVMQALATMKNVPSVADKSIGDITDKIVGRVQDKIKAADLRSLPADFYLQLPIASK